MRSRRWPRRPIPGPWIGGWSSVPRRPGRHAWRPPHPRYCPARPPRRGNRAASASDHPPVPGYRCRSGRPACSTASGPRWDSRPVRRLVWLEQPPYRCRGPAHGPRRESPRPADAPASPARRAAWHRHAAPRPWRFRRVCRHDQATASDRPVAADRRGTRHCPPGRGAPAPPIPIAPAGSRHPPRRPPPTPGISPAYSPCRQARPDGSGRSMTAGTWGWPATASDARRHHAAPQHAATPARRRSPGVPALRSSRRRTWSYPPVPRLAGIRPWCLWTGTARPRYHGAPPCRPSRGCGAAAPRGRTARRHRSAARASRSRSVRWCPDRLRGYSPARGHRPHAALRCPGGAGACAAAMSDRSRLPARSGSCGVWCSTHTAWCRAACGSPVRTCGRRRDWRHARRRSTGTGRPRR